MAENKNTIIVYRDWMHILEKLSDEEAGRLMKHLFRYVNDLEPKAPDRITELTFEPIKLQLKRDLAEWTKRCEKNAEAARTRWNQKNANACECIEKNANAYFGINANAKHADNDIDIDIDIDIDKEKKNKIKSEVKTSHPTPSIEDREFIFRTEASAYAEKYGHPMIEQFCNYWTEAKPGGRKMRFEMEKVFDTGRRLATWSSKDYNNKTHNNGNKKTSGLTTEQEQREFLEAVAGGIARANARN